jgi:hypothetical protein
MGLTFHDWRPFESFDSLANLKPGAEVYVYDPACEPVVFRVLFRGLVRDRATQKIAGITYALPPDEAVEVIANRYRKFGKAPAPSYAPRNRVGASREFDIEFMPELGGGYDS